MTNAISKGLVLDRYYVRNHLLVKPILFGILGGLVLLGLYFGIVSFAGTFRHAVEEFLALWYWIAPLVIGFGIQVGLFTYIRRYPTVTAVSAKSSMAASGGLSTLSMAACCAHHLTDFLPLFGLSAAALFLTEYQTAFLALGVMSNLIGINVMLMVMQKHRFYQKDMALLGKLMGFNLKRSFHVLLVASAVVLGAAFGLIS